VIYVGFKKNITAFLVISLLGVLGHFVFEWTNNNTFIGLFFPVNESIWEHLKLIFFPSLIYFLTEYYFLNSLPKNYIPASIIGVFGGMISVVVLYYTITGIIGANIDFLNILIFFAAVFVTVRLRNKIITEGKEFSKNFKAVLGGLFVISAVLFMLFSYEPPSLNIFIPPMPV